MTGADMTSKKRRNLQSDRKARIHQLYSSDDVIKLYDISRNTLSNWIAGGLGFISCEPRLFRGSDLNTFHRRKKQRSSIGSLGQFEVRCFGCRATHTLLAAEVSFDVQETYRGIRAYRACPDCGATANRYVSLEDQQTILRSQETNPGSKTPD